MKHVFIFFLIFLSGCVHTVPIPSPRQDNPPEIAWGGLIVQKGSGWSGEIEAGKETVRTSTSVGVTEFAQLLLSGSASNPGGVKEFHVKGEQSGQTLWDVTVTDAPDASGLVPDILRILGTSGAGGPLNNPILVTMPPFVSESSNPIIVTATAVNFNGMSKTITISYNSIPVIMNCSCSPDCRICTSGCLCAIGGDGGGTPTPKTASVFISIDHTVGPFQETGVSVPPNFCEATLNFSLTPGSLTGSEGSTSPFTQRNVQSPPATKNPPDNAGLYTVTCKYGAMATALRTGSWTATVEATRAGDIWQAECQKSLHPGTNDFTFLWGRSGCQ